MTRIKIRTADWILSATLDARRATCDFADMLPLDLTLTDYHGIEKITRLPRGIDTSDVPASQEASAGDITFYAPGAIARSS